ncbi:MAG: hypothetical protein AB1513_11470 [Pseudomonadota bacterium]
MSRIRILTGCRASGRGYTEGSVVSVPEDINAEDAAVLMRIGRAVAVADGQEVQDAKPAEKKSGRGNK